MRWSRFLVIAALFSLISCKKAEEKTIVRQEIKLPEMKETFPFSEAEKIELISYSFDDYRHSSGYYQYEIKDGKLPFDETIIKERIFLNKLQQESLFWALMTDNCPANYAVADCYMPEHRIIFYDKNKKVIAFLEVCIQCIGSRKSENLKIARLCGKKMKELKRLFRSAGIKHFSEM